MSTSDRELTAQIVRLWATETHLAPTAAPGETVEVVSPHLAADARSDAAADAPRLAFRWTVPARACTGGSGGARNPRSDVPVHAPAGIADVRLVDGPSVPGERVGDAGRPVDDPRDLLDLLLRVADYRTVPGGDGTSLNRTPRRARPRTGRDGHAPDGTDAAVAEVVAAHEALVDTLDDTLDGTLDDTGDRPDPAAGDPATAGHTPGAWAVVPSLFFPGLDGVGTPDPTGHPQPGRLWAATAPWGGPAAGAPVIPLDELEFDRALTDDPAFPGIALRPADPDADADLVSTWMRLPHLAATFRQAWGPEVWHAELEHLAAHPGFQPMILTRDGEGIGYIELYRPAHMSIGAARPTDPRTAGGHMGLADLTQIRTGLGRRVVDRFIRQVHARRDTGRFTHLLSEPDIRNPAMVGAIRHTVAWEQALVSFPHKSVVLFSSAGVD
ncbi:acetyltransferase [Corynebacterium bovis]|uniref:GNAT family N-acetyltransferase n=1 Tax=Corynebacterium bovis TaxID=36808 RepID=UPI00313A4A6F